MARHRFPGDYPVHGRLLAAVIGVACLMGCGSASSADLETAMTLANDGQPVLSGTVYAATHPTPTPTTTASPTTTAPTTTVAPKATTRPPTAPPPKPPAPPASRTCTNPVFVTSDRNGGWTNGGYYVHNNMWNAQAGGPETLYACAYNNWYVDSTQPNTTSVKTYPNVHLDINNANGVPLNNYRTITTTFAGTGPRVGIYNIAYDIWLNGVGSGNGRSTEFMVWTENFNQHPSGSKIATATFGAMTYDAWHYNGGGSNVISLVARSTMHSGSLDLKAMFDWAIARGLMPANPTVNQIGYGVEICSTNNTRQRFTFTGFSVTMT